MNKPRILILDIETAPHKAYVWSSELRYGRIPADRIVEPAYTLCFAAKWAGPGRPGFWSLRDMRAEKMLHCAWELLDAADIVVHYNGRKFDIPTLQGEFIATHRNPPAPYKQVDLCDWARSNTRFANAKLDTVTQAIGLGKKVQHKGMELWRACMAGDARAWAVMERYNKQDVRLTYDLYLRARPWIRNHPNLSALAQRLACPACGSTKAHKHDQRILAQTQLYQRYRCQSCGHTYRDNKPLPAAGRLGVSV